MEIELLHHVSLNVADLDRSRRFYLEILGLPEIPRPPFNFPGAWFQVGATQQLHLIVYEGGTFREGKAVGTRDNHFAIRVRSYRRVVEFLRSKGYREDAARSTCNGWSCSRMPPRASRRSIYSTPTGTSSKSTPKRTSTALGAGLSGRYFSVAALRVL